MIQIDVGSTGTFRDPDEGETPGKTIVEVEEWANWGTLQNVVHDVHCIKGFDGFW